ncbi:hypothetical protein QR680_014503 [Steinernema hermaphroditum]|uniref:Peptidase S1 domain-containing protein n=1 Tax=Steinernema hermaphroditum TaxID=289476 RepID=A0AA39IAH9_9BILA|nr:hypothetical protein QR680_014503 [Steinernema hermaphroditum]
MGVLPMLLCLLSSALALPIDHDILNVGPSELIFGGKPVKQGDLPMQALTAFIDSRGKPNTCGGTLISKNHVLTAAHCAVHMKDKVMIMVGSIHIQNVTNAQWRKVTKINIHQQYSNDRKYLNDIAILEFSPAVSLNRNVKLANIYKNDEEYVKERRAVIAGFGTYKFVKDKNGTTKTEHSRNLLAIDVTLFPFEFCSKAWSFATTKLRKSEQLCAGAKNKGVGPGDSGGPLYIVRPGRLVQIGITSFGIPNDRAMEHDQDKIPSVFTRISHYCKYIDETTKGAAKCK